MKKKREVSKTSKKCLKIGDTYFYFHMPTEKERNDLKIKELAEEILNKQSSFVDIECDSDKGLLSVKIEIEVYNKIQKLLLLLTQEG